MNIKLRALLWLFILCFFAAGSLMLSARTTLTASVLSLLPKGEVMGLSPELEEGFLSRLDKQVVFLAGGEEDSEKQLQRVNAFAEELRQSGLFTQVDAQFEPDFMQSYGKALFAARTAFIDDKTRGSLKDGGGSRAQYVLSTLYSFASGLGSRELAGDPLLLMRACQSAMLSLNQSRLTLKNNYLAAADDSGRIYYFIRAELKRGGFSLTDNALAVSRMDEIISRHQSADFKILKRGTVFYSHEAATQAQSDVTVLGSATVVLVFLLIFSVFRSILPIALVLLSCAGGALTALFVTMVIFPSVHVMTLVLSVSIVGISVDYSLYYLTSRMCEGQNESPLATLKRLQKPLFLALSSTVCAYLALCAAPFAGIRQMAVFAMAGLIGACLTVFCFHPLLSQGLKHRPLPLKALIDKMLLKTALPFGRRLSVYGAVLALCALLLVPAQYKDDLSAFQELPPHLSKMDQEIAALTGQSADQRWLCVAAPDDESLLDALAAARSFLNQAKTDGLIRGYQSIMLNSETQQQADQKLIAAALPAVYQTLKAVGMSLSEESGKAADFNPYPEDTLTLQQYLSSPLSAGFELLYLRIGAQSAALIPLAGLKDSAALAARLESAGINAGSEVQVKLIDRKMSFDELFSSFSKIVGGMISGALLLIFLLFCVSRGLRDALLCSGPVLCAATCALALPGLFYTLNFFNLLALIPVLGMGINYTLFFANPKGQSSTAALSATLAMLTSLLTLGILVFSHTAAIAAFGLSLSCGLTAALLLSPLARPLDAGAILEKN